MEVQNKTVKQIGELGPRAKRHRRKYWRKAKKRSRAMQNRRLNEIDTPPESPLDQTVKEPTSSRRALAAERERRKTRKRHAREIKALKEKVKKLTKERHKLRKQEWRKKKAQIEKSNVKLKDKTIVDSP